MKKKLLILGVLVLVVLLAFGFDTLRAKRFTITLLSLDPQPAVADGQTPVTILLQLKDHEDRPVEGHTLYIVSKNGGKFRAYRQKTDENGTASFTYFSYKYIEGVYELKDVEMEVRDESNSVIIEIPTTCTFIVPMTAPEKPQGS